MSDMPNNPADSAPASIKPAEFVLAPIVLLALVGAQIFVTHASALFRQTAWLDEVHTLILVNDPDPLKFHAAMSYECVDKNYPVYGQMLRWLRIKSPQAIRAVSLGSTLIGLLGIYYLLRGSFNPIESAVGVLTVWATPLIVYHSFQARFYAPWFASVICFAAALRWGASTRHKSVAAVCIAVTSFFACTLHTLGLPALALIIAAESIFNRRPIKSRMISLLPALTGPIAIVMFMPLLREQLHSYVIASWLVGNPIRLLYSTLADLLPGLPAAVLILGIWATVWLRRIRPANQSNRDVLLSPVAGVSVLILFPLVLFVISVLAQPVLLARYAIISTAAIAPAAAYAASRMKRSIAIVVCLILTLETGAELVRLTRQAGEYHDEISSFITAIHAEPDLPALFESRHQLFPVTWAASDLIDRCAYVDFQPGPNQLDPIIEGSERDVAKKFERVFGWPHVMAWEKVMSLKRFVLISMDEDSARIGRRFEGYQVKQVGRQVYELSR